MRRPDSDDSVACRLRLRTGDAQLLTDDAIEERRFPDVRFSGDCHYSRSWHDRKLLPMVDQLRRSQNKKTVDRSTVLMAIDWGGRTRTCNFRINSPAVCQLTYTPNGNVHTGRLWSLPPLPRPSIHIGWREKRKAPSN